MTDWVLSLQNAKNMRNYLVNFYQGESVYVTAKDAAKIKIAVLKDIKCFELEKGIFMTKNVASVSRDKHQEFKTWSNIEYDELEPPREQVDARKLFHLTLDMNSYISNGKLLDEPSKNLLKHKNENN